MKKNIGLPVVEETFNQVLTVCTRSTTKKDLHPDSTKENVLFQLLENAYKVYGINIADTFQAEHEKSNPGLSYLFAQLISVITVRGQGLLFAFFIPSSKKQALTPGL